MLVVHPTSYCDICFEAYSSSANAPHAIGCGHVFCLTCLHALSRSACPLCREAFQLNSIKKLHLTISLEPDNIDRDGLTIADLFLQRVALASGKGTLEADVNKEITEVQEWLQSQPQRYHMALRTSVAALQEYRALRRQSERAEVTFHRLCYEMTARHAQEQHHLESELIALHNAQRQHRNTPPSSLFVLMGCIAFVCYHFLQSPRYLQLWISKIGKF